MSPVTHHDLIFTNHSSIYELSMYRILKQTCRGPERLLPTRKRPVFVLARPTRLSCAGTLPQELSYSFCRQTFYCLLE